MKIGKDLVRISLALGLAFFVMHACPARAASARENYEFYCAQCHGLDGSGDGPNATESQPVDPRNHRSAYEMGKLTDADIMDAIRYGGSATNKSTLMPPFGKTLTDKEIRDLKDYLRKLCRCRANSSRGTASGGAKPLHHVHSAAPETGARRP